MVAQDDSTRRKAPGDDAVALRGGATGQEETWQDCGMAQTERRTAAQLRNLRERGIGNGRVPRSRGQDVLQGREENERVTSMGCFPGHSSAGNRLCGVWCQGAWPVEGPETDAKPLAVSTGKHTFRGQFSLFWTMRTGPLIVRFCP